MSLRYWSWTPGKMRPSTKRQERTKAKPKVQELERRDVPGSFLDALLLGGAAGFEVPEGRGVDGGYAGQYPLNGSSAGVGRTVPEESSTNLSDIHYGQSGQDFVAGASDPESSWDDGLGAVRRNPEIDTDDGVVPSPGGFVASFAGEYDGLSGSNGGESGSPSWLPGSEASAPASFVEPEGVQPGVGDPGLSAMDESTQEWSSEPVVGEGLEVSLAGDGSDSESESSLRQGARSGDELGFTMEAPAARGPGLPAGAVGESAALDGASQENYVQLPATAQSLSPGQSRVRQFSLALFYWRG